MSDFDAYHKWLGISPQHQPPNHYRLLSLDLYESDPDVIDAAVDRIAAFLQDVATGPHAKESQRLLNEIAVARLCLLDEAQRATYNEHLMAQLAQALYPPEVASEPVSAPPVAPAFAIDTGASSVAKPPAVRKPKSNRPAISTEAKQVAPATPSKATKMGKKPASPLLLLSYVSGGVLLLVAIAFALFGGDSKSKRRAAEEARIRERQESFAEMGRQAESMIPDFEANFNSNAMPPANKANQNKNRNKQN